MNRGPFDPATERRIAQQMKELEAQRLPSQTVPGDVWVLTKDALRLAATLMVTGMLAVDVAEVHALVSR